MTSAHGGDSEVVASVLRRLQREAAANEALRPTLRVQAQRVEGGTFATPSVLRNTRAEQQALHSQGSLVRGPTAADDPTTITVDISPVPSPRKAPMSGPATVLTAGGTSTAAAGATGGSGGLATAASESDDSAFRLFGQQPSSASLRMVLGFCKETIHEKLSLASMSNLKDCLRYCYQSRALLDRLLREVPTLTDYAEGQSLVIPAEAGDGGAAGNVIEASAPFGLSKKAPVAGGGGAQATTPSRSLQAHIAAASQFLLGEIKKEPAPQLPSALFVEHAATGSVTPRLVHRGGHAVTNPTTASSAGSAPAPTNHRSTSVLHAPQPPKLQSIRSSVQTPSLLLHAETSTTTTPRAAQHTTGGHHAVSAPPNAVPVAAATAPPAALPALMVAHRQEFLQYLHERTLTMTSAAQTDETIGKTVPLEEHEAAHATIRALECRAEELRILRERSVAEAAELRKLVLCRSSAVQHLRETLYKECSVLRHQLTLLQASTNPAAVALLAAHMNAAQQQAGHGLRRRAPNLAATTPALALPAQGSPTPLIGVVAPPAGQSSYATFGDVVSQKSISYNGPVTPRAPTTTLEPPAPAEGVTRRPSLNATIDRTSPKNFQIIPQSLSYASSQPQPLAGLHLASTFSSVSMPKSPFAARALSPLGPIPGAGGLAGTAAASPIAVGGDFVTPGGISVNTVFSLLDAVLLGVEEARVLDHPTSDTGRIATAYDHAQRRHDSENASVDHSSSRPHPPSNTGMNSTLNAGGASKSRLGAMATGSTDIIGHSTHQPMPLNMPSGSISFATSIHGSASLQHADTWHGSVSTERSLTGGKVVTSHSSGSQMLPPHPPPQPPQGRLSLTVGGGSVGPAHPRPLGTASSSLAAEGPAGTTAAGAANLLGGQHHRGAVALADTSLSIQMQRETNAALTATHTNLDGSVTVGGAAEDVALFRASLPAHVLALRQALTDRQVQHKREMLAQQQRHQVTIATKDRALARLKESGDVRKMRQGVLAMVTLAREDLQRTREQVDELMDDWRRDFVDFTSQVSAAVANMHKEVKETRRALFLHRAAVDLPRAACELFLPMLQPEYAVGVHPCYPHSRTPVQQLVSAAQMTNSGAGGGGSGIGGYDPLWIHVTATFGADAAVELRQDIHRLQQFFLALQAYVYTRRQVPMIGKPVHGRLLRHLAAALLLSQQCTQDRIVTVRECWELDQYHGQQLARYSFRLKLVTYLQQILLHRSRAALLASGINADTTTLPVQPAVGRLAEKATSLRGLRVAVQKARNDNAKRLWRLWQESGIDISHHGRGIGHAPPPIRDPAGPIGALQKSVSTNGNLLLGLLAPALIFSTAGAAVNGLNAGFSGFIANRSRRPTPSVDVTHRRSTHSSANDGGARGSVAMSGLTAPSPFEEAKLNLFIKAQQGGHSIHTATD